MKATKATVPTRLTGPIPFLSLDQDTLQPQRLPFGGWWGHLAVCGEGSLLELPPRSMQGCSC